LLEGWVVRRLLEPDEALAGRDDRLEVRVGENGRDLPVVAAEQEEDRHVEGSITGEVERGQLGPQVSQGEAVTLPAFDEVRHAGLVCAQRGPDEPSGRQLAVKGATEAVHPLP